MSRGANRSLTLTTALIALLFTTAPTVGDIGTCAQPAVDLDPVRFFQAKRVLDCRHCRECGIATQACQDACSNPPATAFPEGCRPLVHDGEVCLGVLQIASCESYSSWMSDTNPTAPSECQFCPVE